MSNEKEYSPRIAVIVDDDGLVSVDIFATSPGEYKKSRKLADRWEPAIRAFLPSQNQDQIEDV